MRRGLTTGAWLGLLALLASPTLFAASTDDALPPRVEISIPRIERAPLIEELAEMQLPADLAAVMTRIEGFVQREPDDGQPASQRTEVYLGYDDENLHVIFLAFDEEPEKIRAHVARRESVFGDDTVEIQLDTFHDERRAFSFLTNPYGVQWDAIYTEGQGFDDSWDTVWSSDGRLTDTGYVVLMSIPFKSLRFRPSANQTWGVVLVRDIPRNNETSFWPRVTSRIAGRLNQEATLGGLNDISPGRNIWLTPYATGTNFRVLDADSPGGFAVEDAELDAGLDAKMIFKDALTLDLTVNPDFSQVESDNPQVTANERFEVFFPERRPFFLENASFFQTPINLLFTRRIVDPKFGARLTGKIGGWSLGALLIDDEQAGRGLVPGEPGYDADAVFGFLAATRDIGEQSNIGAVYSERSHDGSYNRVWGFHGRFRLDDNWFTRAQAIYSTSRTLDGEELSDPAYSLEFNRDGRALNAHIHYVDIGTEFRADSGFVPRTDVRNAHIQADYKFWPEGKALINWGPRLFAERITDQTGLRLDRRFAPGLEFEFRRQTDLSMAIGTDRERLRPQDFPELAEPTDYSGDFWWVDLNSRFSSAVNLRGFYTVSDAINFSPPAGSPPAAADRVGAEFGVTLRLGRRFRLDGDYLYTRLDDPDSDSNIFTDQIVRTRIAWAFNRKLSLRLILQYEDLVSDPTLSTLEPTERFNGDFLISYIVNPWTAFYVGYNSNYQNVELVPNPQGLDAVRGPETPLFNDARQLFVKVSYLFRF